MEVLSEIKPNVWFSLIGGVFILTGLIFVYVAVKQVRENIDSQRWPQSTATLQDVEVVKRVREDDAENNYRQYVSYFCDLTYEYPVGPQSFTAKRQEDADSREEAVRIAAGHRAGDTIPVYYNPAEPARYRFELASALSGLVWLLPFAAFAGFGWAIMYVGRRFY